MAGERPKVVITHWVHDEVVALLTSTCRVVANATRDTWPATEVLRRCQDASALIAFMPDTVDEMFLACCPRLKIVAGALKGWDNFDAEACARRGVWLTVVPDLLTAPTAELAVALTLGLARRVREGDEWVRSGQFAGWRPRFYGTGLADATVGIVGMGAVGQAIARRLAGFEARLVYADPRKIKTDVARLERDTLLRQCDVVILAAPLTPDTAHLVDAERLAAMKQGALLVNVGRGSVVDEEAVGRSLAAGHLGGYAADVFAFEDWARPDRPREVPAALLDSPRTLFTAHMGSAVDSVRRDIALAAARSVLQALAGEAPDGAVNRPVGVAAPA
jgi:phosphonate dehydrogenase